MKISVVQKAAQRNLKMVFALCLLLIAGLHPVLAQVDTQSTGNKDLWKNYKNQDVRNIQKSPGSHLHSKVLLLGKTSELDKTDQSVAEHYKLTDMRGQFIQVRCNEGLPPMGITVWVYGIVSPVAGSNDEVFIEEKSMIKVPQECLDKQGITVDGIPRPDEHPAWEEFIGKPIGGIEDEPGETITKTETDLWKIIVAIVGGLIILLIITKLLFHRRPAPPSAPSLKDIPTVSSPIPGNTASPLPVSVPMEDSTQLKMAQEGGTVKLNLGTQKLLPGHFEIISGSNKSERIPLCALRTMISRAVGNRPKGSGVIELEGQGISTKQAEVVYDGRSWKLINMADPINKNATMIDGREMGLNEQVDIVEGSQIRICDYQLIFHPIQSYKA